MKKIKSGLLVMAVVLGVSGAFVSKIHAAPKPLDQVYSWSGSSGPFTGTVTQAQTHYGCSSNNILCATGTAPGLPDARIFKP
jgi:hypothetical protein